MTSHLENEIGALKEMLLTMSACSESAVTQAMRALATRDDELARAVINMDSRVDQLEIEIDGEAIILLSKALLATDLRLMTVAMKLSRDLERVADEATTIARRTILLNADSATLPAVDLPRMAGLAVEMLREAVGAFTQHKPEVARAIISRDHEVDELNRKIHEDLISHMVKNREAIPACLNLIVISKCLEHVADSAVSIAQAVVYLYEARDIRHITQPPPPQPGVSGQG